MNVSRFKLVALAVGLAAAGPAFGFNITVASKPASAGGSGTVTDVAASASNQAVATPVTCVTGSSLNCTSTATDGGLQVVLSATPGAGSSFVGWAGCQTTLTSFGGTFGNFCTLASSATAKYVAAYFKPAAYTLTINPPGAHTIAVSGGFTSCTGAAPCTYPIPLNGSVTLTATAAAGSNFLSWAGCSSATNSCNFTMNGPRTVTASFGTAAANYAVGVTVQGSGSVSGTGIACPGDCVGTIAAAGTLALTATPAAGASFTGWYGCSSVAANVCTLNNSVSNRAVTAVFSSLQTNCGGCHGLTHGESALAKRCGDCHMGYTGTTVDRVAHMDATLEVTTARIGLTQILPKPDQSLTVVITGKTVTATDVTNVTFRINKKDGTAFTLGATNSPGWPSIVLSKLNADGTFKSYYARYSASAAFGTPPVNPNRETAQDTNAFAGDPDTSSVKKPANFTDNGDGTYTFTFPTLTEGQLTGTKAPYTKWVASSPAVAPADANLYHQIAIYGDATIDGYGFRGFASTQFIPATGATPSAREVVSDAACNACHGQLEFHGRRRGVASCLGCHNPSTIDPESNLNVDLATMVHKIHNGELLTKTGAERYFIVGYNQEVMEIGHILMAPSHGGYLEGALVDLTDPAHPVTTAAHDPGLSRECGICHQGAQANNAFTNPSIRACGSCHDGTSFTAHNGAGDVTAVACTDCHGEGAVRRVHSRFYDPLTRTDFAALATDPVGATSTFTVSLVSVANVDPGVNTSMIFTIDVALNGKPFNIKTLPAGWKLPTCAFQIAGPTSDFTIPATGGTAVSCTSNNKFAAVAGTPGRYTWTAANFLKGKANGYYTAAFEIMASREVVVADVGGLTSGRSYIRKPISANPNFLTVKSASNGLVTVVTDPLELAVGARRTVVDFAKCNACHVDLGFHSNRGRKGPDYCATCHNPKLDNGGRARYPAADARDASTFLATEGTAKVYLPESVSMNIFIHRIHMGGKLPSVSLKDYEGGAAIASKLVQKQGEIVYGATRSAYVGNLDSNVTPAVEVAPDRSAFSEFAMPNPMTRCDQCHINQAAKKTWALNEGSGLAPIERTLKVCNPVTPSWAGSVQWCDNAASSGPAAYVKLDGTVGKIITPPLKAVCTSCHDSDATDQHADAFTVNPMQQNAVEYCASCHGAGTVFDSLTVHRIMP